MELIISPRPAFTFRSLGGILDAFFFTGLEHLSSRSHSSLPAPVPLFSEPDPLQHVRDTLAHAGAGAGAPRNPDRIIAQYWNLTLGPQGIQRPAYWALGYHQCRWGYLNDTNLMAVINRTIAAKFPYDAQWTDIDYMRDHLDWTYDPKAFAHLPDVVRYLHALNMHYVPIVDPGISTKQPAGSYPPYDRGLEMNVFVRDFNGKPLVGEVWPGKTVFPDWTNPNATQYWTEAAAPFFHEIPFDGMWTDMNEPSNFDGGSDRGCTTTREEAGYALDHPPYTPPLVYGQEALLTKTVCPSARHANGTHYDLHNLYGYTETVVTHNVQLTLRPNVRPFIVSRSSYVGHGRYGFTWTGDQSSNWDDLARSIPSILSFGLFGIPFTGEDICGFGGDTTEELCTRWMQLGSFYPFMRNHNDLGRRDQDPAAFSESALLAMRNATVRRYQLLPFLYTLFARAAVLNELPIRPLFMLAPFDQNTHAVDNTFMWGDALLVAPVLKEKATTVRVYLPRITLAAGPTRWFQYVSGEEISVPSPGGVVELPAPLDSLQQVIRGGAILPSQISFTDWKVNTFLSRQSNFQLLVALGTLDSEISPKSCSGAATGDLYLDDSISQDSMESKHYSYIKFSASTCSVSSRVLASGYDPERDGAVRKESAQLDAILIYGFQRPPASAVLDGKPVTLKYNATVKSVLLTGFRWHVLKPFTIIFTY